MSAQTYVVYFWIAFYSGGSCLPQYDLETGQQHFFKEIDHSRLIKFGWFPFTVELASKVGDFALAKPDIPYHVLEIGKNQRLIALRREYQHFFTYTHCLKCRFNWQWMPDKPDGSIGDAHLPRFGSEKYFYQETGTNGKPVFEVICPKCGTRNDLKCPECHEWWNKIADEDTKNEPPEKRTYHLECPKCKKIAEKRTITGGAQSIECLFLLGWQETLPDGRNHKMIMFIRSDGAVTLSDDFNAL